jgi:hypothetical protein
MNSHSPMGSHVPVHTVLLSALHGGHAAGIFDGVMICTGHEYRKVPGSRMVGLHPALTGVPHTNWKKRRLLQTDPAGLAGREDDNGNDSSAEKTY